MAGSTPSSAAIFDVVFAFPSLLIAIMAVALFGKGLVAPVIAMSIAYAPFVARLTRSLVAAERTRPYVAAYRVQGFGGRVDRARAACCPTSRPSSARSRP